MKPSPSPSPSRVARRFVAALNLARKYRFSSEMMHLANVEVLPDFEWADQWEGSVTSLADRFLSNGG